MTDTDTDRFLAKNYIFDDNPVPMYPHWQDSNDNFLCYPEKFNWHPTQDITQALGDSGPDTVVGRMHSKKIWLRSLCYNSYTKEWIDCFIDANEQFAVKFADKPATTVSCSSSRTGCYTPKHT